MVGNIILLATNSNPTVTGAMGDALSTVATDAVNAITSMIPVAAPILGGIIVIGIAIKAFKKIAGR